MTAENLSPPSYSMNPPCTVSPLACWRKAFNLSATSARVAPSTLIGFPTSMAGDSDFVLLIVVFACNVARVGDGAVVTWLHPIPCNTVGLYGQKIRNIFVLLCQ